MSLEGLREVIDSHEEAIVDRSLVLQGLDLMPPVFSLLVDLVLLGSDE